MFKKSNESQNESKPVGKKEKTLKRIGYVVLIICALLFILIRCAVADTTPDENNFKDAKIVDVMNGSNDKKIGESSVLKMNSEDVTDEFLVKWVENHVVPGNFNWAVIVYKDKGSDNFGVYSIGEGTITKDVGLTKQSDGSYMLGNSTKETKNYSIKDGKLVEVKPSQDAANNALTPEQKAELGVALLESSFKDTATIKFDKKTNSFMVTPTDPGFTSDLMGLIANPNNQELRKAWEDMKGSFVYASESITKSFGAGYNLTITNPQNTDNQLLVARDGVVIYDFLRDGNL